MNERLKSILQSERVKQVASLFSVNMLAIPLSFVTSVLLTAYLGPRQYGDYTFIVSVFSFAVMVATLGFFQAGNRAIVLSENRDETRGYYGALFVIMGGLYVLMTTGLLLYSFYDRNLEAKGLTTLLACLSPLAFITLWGRMYETVLPADNQITMLSKIRLYPVIANLLLVSGLYFVLGNLQSNKLLIVLLVYNITQLLLYVYVAFALKPSFKYLRRHVKEIFEYNRAFGFNVYAGALFGVGVGYLTPILVSYFGADNVDVGYYSLANSFAQPLIFIPATIATTHYKDFAGTSCVSRRLQITTLGLSFVALVLLWAIVPILVNIFFKPEFQPAIGINFILSIGVLMHGMADFFNRFIQAHGRGDRLRNTAMIVGVVTLASSVLFIPRYGAYGAAYSRIVSGFVYLSVIYIYYRKTCSGK